MPCPPRLPRPRPPLLAALCALLFGLVTWQVAAGGPLRDLDERLGRGTGRPGPLSEPGHRDPAGVLAEFFADLGHVYVALPVAAAAAGCAGWLAVRHASPGPRWRPPLLTACALTAVPLLVVPLKAWTDRPGPVSGDGYYPSGHTVTAAVAHGAAVLLLLPYVRRSALRRLLAAGVLLVNLGVGAGLVRRGYHWPLDVLGGWLLSAVLLCALAAALRGRHAPRQRTEPGAAEPDCAETLCSESLRAAPGPAEPGPAGPEPVGPGRAEPGRPAGGPESGPGSGPGPGAGAGSDWASGSGPGAGAGSGAGARDDGRRSGRGR
ncbi:phosphatase PAP2 family protein [Streptomyces lycii]|uniref:phosphatase PAP2 family protein n=1 Tax=Streptomyces lycii TaxID=2654337 RepID=UPI002E26BB34